MASSTLFSTIRSVVTGHAINGRTVRGGAGIIGQSEPSITGVAGFRPICGGASRTIRSSTVVGSRVDAGIVGEGEPRITGVACLVTIRCCANSTLRNSTVLS